MFVLSLKASRPRVWVTTAVVAVLLVTMLVLSSGQPAAETAAPVTDDAARRGFLSGLGYELDPGEAQVREILIPAQPDEAYTAYQQVQKEAGYDLEPYRGKRVKCWQYTVTNYPGATGVTANLYVYKNQIIGGDISSTAGEGFCHGLTSQQPGE